MYRVNSHFRGVTARLLSLLLALVIAAAPTTVDAVQRHASFDDRGGSGGGVVGPTEGDPIDSNDYGPTDPPVSAGDPIYHTETDRFNLVTTGTLGTPGFTIGGRWFVYLIFDPGHGRPLPSIGILRLAKVRGE